MFTRSNFVAGFSRSHHHVYTGIFHNRMPIAKPYLLLDDVNSELNSPLLSHEDMDSDEDVLVNSVHVGGASHLSTTDLGETTFSTTHKITGAKTVHKNGSKGVQTNDAVTNSQTAAPSGDTVVVVPDVRRQISEEEVTFFNRYDVETEETMKCIVTSVMFIVIIAAIVIVAFVVNPQV